MGPHSKNSSPLKRITVVGLLLLSVLTVKANPFKNINGDDYTGLNTLLIIACIFTFVMTLFIRALFLAGKEEKSIKIKDHHLFDTFENRRVIKKTA